MHKCTFCDRIEIENGQVVRVVTAIPWAKKLKDKRLDVYKETESGECFCRNLYYSSVGGYCIAFPGEKNSLWRKGYNEFTEPEEPFCPTAKMTAFRHRTRKLRESEAEKITGLYPEFKYVLNKWKGTIVDTMKALDFWKEHKETEYLLAAGAKAIAFNKSFWRLSEKSRKAVAFYIRKHPRMAKELDLSEMQVAIKRNLTDKEILAFKLFKREARQHRFGYDKFAYLRKICMADYNGICLYADYLNMLKQSHHDAEDAYWRYPKDLVGKHDQIYNELNAEKIAKDAEARAKKEAAYKKTVKKLFKLKAKIGGYDVFVPETIDEIERQADALSQCLIYCDYVQEVIDKKCVLVFVQKDGVPVATAELLSRNRIGQFYADEADRDDCLPPEDVVNAVKEWIKRKKAA